MAKLQFFARCVHWDNSYLGILKSYRVHMHLNVLETFIATGIFTLFPIVIMIFVINMVNIVPVVAAVPALR
jgi:hypothetical protein